MPTYVGLLRAVNVGGKNKVPMAELRDLFESLGYTAVSTYIQSGNVVFSSRTVVTPARLGTAIARRFKVETTVVLRTRQQLEKVMAANPFPRAKASTLHVGFMSRKPSAAAVKALDADHLLPDRVAARGTELYLNLPNGMGRSKLPAFVDRKLGIPTTYRNWATVTKLLELAQG